MIKKTKPGLEDILFFTNNIKEIKAEDKNEI
ncbi:MAG: hypothetical protein CM1200mP33_7060 [Chloroflexota bacterium]|nr:MAG: hypothetical protein CM1200mP33_7060 [Chloroflexota bacterium]